MEFKRASDEKWNKSDEDSTANHPADLLFAESLLQKNGDEECIAFLAHLFASAREGHLCSSIQDTLLLRGAEKLPEEIKATYLHCEGSRWYLRRNWEIERLFIEQWNRLRQATPKQKISQEILEKKLQALKLEKEQEEAIRNGALHSLSFICGGPGTGKTYTAAKLITLFLEIFPGTVVAAAPTGKAAANLREKLPEACEVQTLHSALRKKAFYTADVILIDEGSMVDAATMAALFSQAPTGSRLIMLGDPNQLPPVETGNLFADLIKHPTSSVTRLKKCLRAELQEIVEMAAQVLRGDLIASLPLPDSKAIVNKLLEKVVDNDSVQPEELFDHYCRFRALCPLRQGPYGTDALNQLVFRKHCSMSSNPLVPILITENHSDCGLFNGDIGILSLKREEAFFSGGRYFPKYLLPRYEWAYLLSVHKSQGSEYDEVMLLIPDGSERFGREVLYTAITRARKKVSVFGDQNTIEQMLQKTTPRSSGI